MNSHLKKESFSRKTSRTAVLIAAYDAGMRTSEGYVARSLLSQLDPDTKIILVTRKNNVSELLQSSQFQTSCPNVHLVGYDLPKWAAWWKKGARGYELYAYLWQISWPFALKRKRWLIDRLSAVHTLNFHNDSIPSMGWVLGKPSIWGPINHNEGIRKWRLRNWPYKQKFRNTVKSTVRKLAWRIDPLLALSVRNSDVVVSAGSWVDRRLRLRGRANVWHRSQLGLDVSNFTFCRAKKTTGLRLVIGGRLDWIKGLDVALEALAKLPETSSLTLIGDGPCKDFLVKHARRLGISERVTFISAVSREQLLHHYVDHDIFLFPSAEAAGLAWVEALASGLPVVGFEGPTELSDMADRLPGIVLAKDKGSFEENTKALAEAIEVTVSRDNNPETISLSAREHYCWDEIAGDIQAAYRAAAEVKP